MIRYFVPLLAAMSLSACSDEPAEAPPSAEGTAATGDVQQGSISDDMIATDTLESRSPSLAAEPEESTGDNSVEAE